MLSVGTGYSFGVRLDEPLGSVRSRVEAALKAQGFGVLTEIDVAATLRSKLGVEREPYVILGACNPPLAHRAIEAEPSIGVLLPCNVVLRADGDATIVEAMDPNAALGLVGDEEVREVAAEARSRLLRAIDALATTGD